MRPPDRYSASPLYNFVTVPTQHVSSFAEMLRTVWRWWRGQGPNWRERAKDARMVERLAEEIAAELEAEPAEPKDKR